MRSQDIEIPEPCHADWDAMRPEQRGKFCFDCQKSVHDLSSMTEDEAREFLRANACNDICISFEHDEDGALHFQPAPPRPAPQPTSLVPLSRLRRPRKIAAAVAGVGVAAALAACAPHGEGPAVRHETESSVFHNQTVVIPHGEAGEATPVPPPTAVVDEPCDPPTPATSPVRKGKIKGKIKRPRTAGKPIMRKTGDVATIDPLAL